ncbi:RrF2 family transcriptional regulator [Chitinimonas lacunae]|uniref:RrF2 family transcriptional regulator n=1 Tax=Chitinimonas lacunae TaxID=1963018 RepID=A0ABV8MT23_9NEIS
MQLTRFADLGLRVLMYLSRQQEARVPPVTSAEIATQFGIPHNHLVKVVNRLAKLGLVIATRGRNGGLRLGREATMIRLGSTLRALETDAPLIDCAQPPCLLQGRCGLKGILDRALDAFYASLDDYTLADVTTGSTASALGELQQQYLVRLLPS